MTAPSAYDDAVDVLTHWRAPDEEQEALRVSYLTHLAANPDGVVRECLPDHLTAGALVVSPDRRQVLMNLHRKAGIWVAFGGHVEATDATLAGAALREATEESGIEGLVLHGEPVQLDIHPVSFCAPGVDVRHLDVRFVAVAPEGAEPVVSEESTDIRWFPVEEVPTEEDSMRRLIARARRL